MNAHDQTCPTERAGASSGIAGRYTDGRSLGPQVSQAPVHAAQEGLDKAIAGLLNEVDSLRGALSTVLAPVNEAGQKDAPPIPRPNSVCERINTSTSGVMAAARQLAELRSRLEV